MLTFRYTEADVYKQRVQTGYRLMLVYNIQMNEPRIPPLATRMNDAEQDLGDIFGRWEQEIASHPSLAPKHLVYMMERPSANSNLRLESLRGEDHLKACHLMTACQTRGFCFFLATMRYTVIRYLDVECDDENHCPCCIQHDENVHAWHNYQDRNCSILAIVTADGEHIGGNILVDNLSVVQDLVVGPNAKPNGYSLAGEMHRDLGLDDGESDSDLQMRGLVRVYHLNCIVLVPRAFRLEFLWNEKRSNELGFDIWVNTILQEIENEHLSMASKNELKELCRRIVASGLLTSSSGVQLKPLSIAFENIVTAALRLNDPDLFENTLKYHAAVMLRPSIFGKIGQSIPDIDLNIWEQRFVLVVWSK